MSNIIDDGLNSELVQTAFFDGILEIPRIEKPEKIIIPKGMVPFSKRNHKKAAGNFICFYEYDIKFANILTATKDFVDEFKNFPGIISPDCSVYTDMPLVAQAINIYMSRAVGVFFQNQGKYVIPNVRWGDERTYTTCVLPEKIAFLGIPKNSIVSIGSYACLKNKETRTHFRNGLIAMLDELEPEVVLVYGAMPDSIFGDLKNRTTFVQYLDWTSRMKQEVNAHGNR